MYFESHAHYDDKAFDTDRRLLLEKLPENGIDYVVNAGADMASSLAGIELSRQYDYFYAAVGVHPHDAKNMSDEDISTLRAYAKLPKVVAIGEIGLDYHYDNSPRDIQKYWFKQQLALAKETDLPVIIHAREASADCFDLIQNSQVAKGVIHCYSGGVPMALEYIQMGFYIGIGGVITYKNARKLVEVAQAVPIEKILIETDCPYLSPVPNRGQRNDSRNLRYVVEMLSEIKSMRQNEVASVTKSNAMSLFLQ